LEVGLGEKLENHHICGCDTFVAITRRARARAPKYQQGEALNQLDMRMRPLQD